MLVLLLISLIGAGAAAFHFWSQKDAFIYHAVDSKLSEIFPSCFVSFENVQVVDASQFIITQLQLRSKKNEAILAQIPRVTINVDGKLLSESRRVVVKSLEVESPQLFALRDENGSWNWDDFQLAESKQDYSPSLVVKNGQVQVGLKSLANGQAHTISTRGLEFAFSPEAMNRYKIEGEATVESLGTISLDGLYDSNSGEWSLTGHAGQVRIDEPLLEQAGNFFPQVETRLAQIKQSPQFIAKNRIPVQTASNTKTSPQHSSTKTESLIRADLDLNFSVGQAEKNAPLDYLVKTKIEHGQVSDLFLPIPLYDISASPLYDISASLEVAPDRITVDNFRAANNKSSLFIDGEAIRSADEWSRNFVVRATQWQIDEWILSILPDEVLKVYRLISPTGTFDLDFDITQEPGKAWSGELRKFTARNCRVLVDYFRSPVEDVQGQITYQDDRFVLEMNGRAGRQPVSCKGYFGAGINRKNFDISVSVNNFPIDDRFIEAFGRKDLTAFRDTLKSLRLSGATDFVGRFFKNEQTNQQLKMQLAADVHNSTLNFVNFPYQLEGLSGQVRYDNSQEKIWKLSDLKARHGHSVLTANGAFDLTESPGKLNLEIGAVRIPIDSDLEKASLVSSPHLEPLWSDFDLAGTLDVEKVLINWKPGTPTQLTMEGIQWKDGTIRPAAFPYVWNDIVASLEWTGERLNIHSLHGWHGETYLEIKGTDPDWPTFVEVPATGPIAWNTYFGNMMIVKAKFEDDLIRALPVSIATTFKAMDLQGDVNVQLRADMRGWTKDPNTVTANWEVQTVLENNSLFAGVQLDKVTGKVKIRDGVWDGQNLRMEGAFDLQEAVALNFPFKNVRSPFHLDGSRLIIGSPKFLDPPLQFRKANEYAGKQLRADIYAGQIGYDALVLIGPRPELTQYKAELNINDVELAELAADQSPNTRNVKGKVNGIMAYQGMGPSPESIQGKGWVNIVPAAIMDLPAFTQMFALINFRPVRNTAFNYAFGEFGINKGRFEFSRIELRGDALGLDGKGVVGFSAGSQSLIDLTFDSRTNNQVPVIGKIIDGLGSKWIRVQVTGTVENPKPEIKTRIGPLDDIFREFNNNMERGQNIRPPLRFGAAKEKNGF
jgi:hypothetical protein